MSKELETTIKKLEQLIEHADQVNIRISEKSVDWHIDHSLKVIIKSCEALKKSDPSNYKVENNPIRTRIFKTGSIPRGVAKAPKTLMALDKIQIKELQDQFSKAKKQIDEVKNLHENCHFKHPYFGLLNLSMANAFFVIHTEHHLKIIRDIINK